MNVDVEAAVSAAAPPPFASYKQALAWLYGTQVFGIKLGLENVRRLFIALNIPGREQRIIHVAGTNGKGSVCAMLDSILRVQGYRTGLFTSPHLVTFRERIQVNGEMIPEDAVPRPNDYSISLSPTGIRIRLSSKL